MRGAELTITDYKLTSRDIKVLMALENNPLGTYDELAIKTNISKSVIHGIVKILEDRPDRKKAFFTVIAHPNLESLGLEIVDVLVDAPTRVMLLDLIKVGLAHPYTVFQTFIYGANTGMFCQFRIPSGTVPLLHALFERLLAARKIQAFTILKFSRDITYTFTDVEKWDNQNNTWDFSWRSWFAIPIPESAAKTNLRLKEFGYERLIPSSLNWIRTNDLAILAELTYNSRRKNLEIKESIAAKYPGRAEFNFTAQTFGRHLKRITDECVSLYRVAFHNLSTEPLNPILLLGTAKITNILKLVQRIKHIPFPFNSVFKYNETGISWFLHIPSSHIYPLLPLIRPYLDSMQFHYLDAPNAYAFNLSTQNFDQTRKIWRQGEDFMLGDVLKEIKDPNFFTPHDREKIVKIFGEMPAP
ncbi:MAG: MarR family transcriptional regulator [Promethearchaeota archaeon]